MGLTFLVVTAVLVLGAAVPPPALATPEQAAVAEANRERLFAGIRPIGLNEKQQDRVIANLRTLYGDPPWTENQVDHLFDEVFTLANAPLTWYFQGDATYQKRAKEKVVANFYEIWNEYQAAKRAEETQSDDGTSETGGGAGQRKTYTAILPLEFSDLIGKLLGFSSWFLGIATMAYAVIAMYRGFSLAFPDSSRERAEGQQALLHLAIGGCLIFGSWLVVAVLKAIVEQY